MPVSTPLKVVGAYLPCSEPGSKHIRRTLYKYIAGRIPSSHTQNGDINFALAGDLNATLWDTDRQSGTRTPMDIDHAEQTKAMGLQPIREN
jgi:hypothetical protein